MKILITCDEMTPQAIPLWEDTWDKLKQKHKKLKITVFTIPLWKNRRESDVFKNKKFQNWYKMRKSWVELAQLGYTCEKPPECTRFKKPQYAMIKRGYRKLISYMPETIHTFKPPYNRMDGVTLSILQELGFTCCIYYKSIILLKKTESPIEDFVIKETHISVGERYSDNINLIYEKIDNYLSSIEKENDFVTISELLKSTIKE